MRNRQTDNLSHKPTYIRNDSHIIQQHFAGSREQNDGTYEHTHDYPLRQKLIDRCIGEQMDRIIDNYTVSEEYWISNQIQLKLNSSNDKGQVKYPVLFCYIHLATN